MAKQVSSLGAAAKARGIRSARARRSGVKRDADRTRENVLRAAVTEFAAKGYSGARVEAICRSARANPRMLYHHFGNKDRLYVAVLERVIGDLRREELGLVVDHVGPFDGMLRLFDFIHGHFGQHPELIHLLSGENLLRARFLRRSARTPTVSSPLIDLIARLLRRGVRQGVIRRGIDPLHLYVMMVALSYFHRSNAYTLSAIFRTDLLASRWQTEHKRHAGEMLVRYLRSGEAPRAAPRGARAKSPRKNGKNGKDGKDGKNRSKDGPAVGS